jgi:phosphatidate cytidylyltransferase
MERREETLQRIVVAIVALPITFGALWLGGAWSAALFALAAGQAVHEYYRIVFPEPSRASLLGTLCVIGLPLLPWLAPQAVATAALGLVTATSMLLWVDHVLDGPRPSAPTRIGHAMAGMLFVGPGMLALSALRAAPDGFFWSATLIATTWANDTAAYFTGRHLGRHKILPAVSPGKTWEGFAGGAAGGLVMANLTSVSARALAGLQHGIAMGLVAALVGPLGDLAKSLLKRAYHVKDSGRLFPGHGGMLDRIDAVLFNAPVVWVYVHFAA